MFQRLLEANRPIKFMAVGGFGFLVDIILFSLCLQVFSMEALAGRMVAFSGAATMTWTGNRLLTFSDRHCESCWRQWQKHMMAACFSALPNFAVFQLCLISFGSTGYSLYMAMIMGIAAGMCSNYLLSLYWVFARRAT
ncbi:GtrA family protein [Endozoicomonas elysicola]|nr:GtrA family protein [Endozoicomonas elysicola]